MNKQRSASGNQQSASPDRAARASSSSKPKAGKDAASHTKAGSKQGAGGGVKQARKH